MAFGHAAIGFICIMVKDFPVLPLSFDLKSELQNLSTILVSLLVSLCGVVQSCGVVQDVDTSLDVCQ